MFSVRVHEHEAAPRVEPRDVSGVTWKLVKHCVKQSIVNVNLLLSILFFLNDIIFIIFLLIKITSCHFLLQPVHVFLQYDVISKLLVAANILYMKIQSKGQDLIVLRYTTDCYLAAPLLNEGSKLDGAGLDGSLLLGTALVKE